MGISENPLTELLQQVVEFWELPLESLEPLRKSHKILTGIPKFLNHNPRSFDEYFDRDPNINTTNLEET